MFLSDGSRVPIAPQALAELNPIIPQGYYYADHVGMDLEYRHALYGQIYERNPWVHTVIEKRANAVSRLPVNVWDVDKAGTRVLDTQSQYARLIADPCPFLDPFSFWGWIQRTLDIYGESYLAICRDDRNMPIGFFPMHPSRVALKRDPATGRYTYFFQAGSGIGTELMSFDQDDVVPFRLFHPEKVERGMSRMEAIRSTIFSEDSSRNAVSAMWKNSGRPNLVLEKANGKISPDGAKKLREAFDLIHSGTANTGKALILEEGVTARPLQLSAVELELIESRRLNREEICAVYDIAPTLVGILDHATFSNISEQMRAFYRDTMAPALEFIQSVMDKYVGSKWQRKNIMRFAVDEVIRGDFEMRAEAAQHLITCGVMTPNEGRELLGLNRMDDSNADKLTNLADRLYANSAIQPLGAPSEQIRIMGQLTGPTPDGIGGPPSTPVASLDGGKPNSVPQLPAGRSASSDSQGPSNAGPSSSAVPKHLRALKGQVGRGRSDDELLAFAYKLYDDHPDDLDDLLKAVGMAIAERDSKRGK